MRARRSALLFVAFAAGVVCSAAAAGAQPRSGGALAPLPAKLARCRVGTATPELQRAGVVRVVTLEIAGPRRRSLVVGTALRGNAITLSSAVASAAGPDIAAESLSASFANGGGLRSGERIVGGARGRRTALTAAEGARAFAFAKGMLARCSRR